MRIFASLVMTGLLLTACGSGDDAYQVDTNFIRLPAPGANMAAAYLTLESERDDRLISAEIEGVETTELHTVDMDDGVMRMRQVEGYDVKAGEPLVLKPGGNHLMLIGIDEPLLEDETRDVTLRFASGDERVLDLPIRKMSASNGHNHH
ncbi:MAG: copper chaperone PCu(A)C [Pseudomonadota bacterium]